MRHFAFVLSLAALAACGADSPTSPTPPAPTTAAVYFRIDGVSCTGVDAVTLYIDGTPIGTETLAAGGSPSSPHVVAIGSHGLGAKEVNSPFYVWPTLVESIPAAGFTFLLTC
jgi:hypothetical protein